MDAIVIAGGIPQPQDPLYRYSHGDSKALIDVAGKPMIQWVLDALCGAKSVEHIILVGLSSKNELVCNKPVHYVSNQGRMLANIVSGVHKSLELNKKNKYVLVVSSDIPTIKPEMVDWLVETCMETEDDLYYGVCLREVMEKRFPESKRTYTRLKDIELCGADINISHVRMATEHLDMWESLIGSRKSPLKQASIIGLDTFFRVITRSITLEDLVEKVSSRMDIRGRAIVWPHAEPCMDVDKPHQLELLRTDLAQQQRKLARKAASAAKKATKKTTKSGAVKSTGKRTGGTKRTSATASSRARLKTAK